MPSLYRYKLKHKDIIIKTSPVDKKLKRVLSSVKVGVLVSIKKSISTPKRYPHYNQKGAVSALVWNCTGWLQCYLIDSHYKQGEQLEERDWKLHKTFIRNVINSHAL